MSYRTRIHSTTGMSPFFLMFGREMNKFETWSHEKEIDKLLALEKRTNEIKQHFDTTVPETVKAIEYKQIEQTNIQNKANNVRDEPLPIGAVIYLKNEGLLTKLAPRYKGPYTIVGKTKNNNYKLKDAAGLMLDKTYPIEKFKLTVDHQTDDIYAVECILDDRIRYRRQQYLVKWKNFPESENSWENESNFVSMLPIKLYWESRNSTPVTKVSNDTTKTLRRSKRIEKVNCLTQVRPITLCNVYFLFFFIWFLKEAKATSIRDTFRYCEGLSKSRVADLHSVCSNLVVKKDIFEVPGFPNGSTPFNVAIMKKITHSISGSGFQCSMEKVIITTHTSVFFDQNDKVSIEPISLSASDCWYMVHSKRCKDKQMMCDGPSCIYKANIKPTYRWLETILHEDYSCKLTPRIISAKNVGDQLFGTSGPSCTASNLFCVRQDHIIVWTASVIHSCPFEVIADNVMFQKGHIMQSYGHRLLFQMTEIVDYCGEKIVSTTEGLYLLAADRAVSFRKTKSRGNDLANLALADEDYATYSALEQFHQLQQTLCHHSTNTIKVFAKFENEYIEINDIKGNPLILYATNGNVYIPHCTYVNEITILPQTANCYKDIPIQFIYHNKTWNAFLQRDNIIKRNSKLVHCQAINNVITIGKNFEVKRNGSSTQVRPQSLIHYEKLNLVNVFTPNYNFHHLQELIESADVLEDSDQYMQVNEDAGHFIISTDNMKHAENVLVKPIHSLVDKTTLFVHSTKQKIKFIYKVVLITVSFIILFSIIAILWYFRYVRQRDLRFSCKNKTKDKFNVDVNEIFDVNQSHEPTDKIFPNLSAHPVNLAVTNQMKPPIYSDTEEYEVSETTKQLATHIVQQLSPSQLEDELHSRKGGPVKS